MPEILEKCLDTARVSESDTSQAVSKTPDASSTERGQSVPGRSVPHRRPLADLSASIPTEFVACAFPPVRMIWPVEEWGESFLSPSEAELVRSIRDDIDELADTTRASRAVKLCLQFGEGIGLDLARHRDVRVAVFEDEDGSVAMVAHYGPKRRQVTFEFHADGRTIGVVFISENMERKERECSLVEAETLRDAIAWLSR